MMSTRTALSYLGFAAVTAGAAAIGARASRRNMGLWYRLLRKPSWQPPRAAFPIVWTALYGLAATSGARVFTRPTSPERSRALALWGVQMVTNAAWTPLFFATKRPKLALADLGGLLGSLVGYAVEARKVDRAAAWMVAPYIAWVSFAGLLNGAIVKKNRWLAA